MELILSIVSYHRFTSDLEAKKSITLHDVSPVLHIGRSQACEWCLPDPERVISGQHARIEAQGNGFIITDTSTNGLFINRSVEPLGKDNHYELRDGDFISFGDYEIEVAIGEIAHTQPEPAVVDNSAALQPEAVAAQATQDDWEFGFNASQLSSSQASSTPSAQDVLQGGLFDTPMPGTESHATSTASLFAGNLEDNFIAPERDPHSQATLQDSDEEVFAIPENWSDNILPETARNIPSAPAEPVTSAPTTSQYRTEDNDEFDLAEPAPSVHANAVAPEVPVATQAAQRVQVPVQESVREPVQVTAPETTQASTIDPVMEPLQETAQEPVQEPVHKPVQDVVQQPIQKTVQAAAQEPVQETVQEPVQREATVSVKEPVHEPEPEATSDPRHAPQPVPPRVQPRTATPVQQATATQPRSHRPAPAEPRTVQAAAPQRAPYHPSESAAPRAAWEGDHDAALAAFVEGLGIDRSMVPEHNAEQWWFEMGASMQLMMTGLMDTLHERSAFKQHNRLNQTLFKRQENNPLKFSASLEDAIHNLYNRRSASFLSPDRAISEAFDDIKQHEQALLAGVEGTVHSMMKLLSPDSIASRADAPSFFGRMSAGGNKAQNWATYVEMYQRLNNDLDSASHSVYTEDFVKAYEAYLKGVK